MRTILIADRDADFASFLARELEAQAGLRVLVANSAALALQRVSEIRPDVAVIDADLPESSLDDLLNRLRAHVPELPVVLLPLPGHVATPNQVQAQLNKPVFLPELLTAIDSLAPEIGPGLTAMSNVTPPGRLARRSLGEMTAGLSHPSPDPRLLAAPLQRLSQELQNDPVLLTEGELVLAAAGVVADAAEPLQRAIAHAWAGQSDASEVLRFANDGAADRYALYSVRLIGQRLLSIGVRSRLPLAQVRRAARVAVREVEALLK